MASWIIVSGITPDLAFSELRALFPAASLLSLSASCVLLEEVSNFSAEKLPDVAGGVVKVAQVVKTLPQVDAQSLADILLARPNEQKIVFGVSRYDGAVVPVSLLTEIKHKLETSGKQARFIEAKHTTLSSVVIAKQGMAELVVAKRNDQWIVGRTVAVQDFEGWNKRDYGRPYADPKAGMLPPKIARMAVNIAIGTHTNQTILDPFCGMGTICAEGLLRTCRVMGSDQSEDVVVKARANIRWLATQYPSIVPDSATFLVSDATHISQKVPPASVDAIVTEPFMGTTEVGTGKFHDPEKIKNTVKGLEKLYIGCLKDWHTVLVPAGKVVIALPKYTTGTKTFFVKKVVDSCENLGYTTLAGPIEYGRPQAVVKREFFIFQKTYLWHTSKQVE